MFSAILRGILYHFSLYGIGLLTSLTLATSYKLIPSYRDKISLSYSRFMCRLLLRSAGVELIVAGKEHFDAFKNQPVILLSNHITTLDVPIQMSALRTYDIRYMYSLKTVLSIPVVGYIIQFIFNSFGWLGVDPDNVFTLKRFLERIQHSDKKAFRVKLGIYPEGDRSKKGEINEFRSGAFYLAVLLGLPILPILMQGVSRIHRVRTLPVYPRKVGVRILPPVFPPPIKEDLSNVHSIVAELQRKINRLYTAVPNLNMDYNAYALWEASTGSTAVNRATGK